MASLKFTIIFNSKVPEHSAHSEYFHQEPSYYHQTSWKIQCTFNYDNLIPPYMDLLNRHKGANIILFRNHFTDLFTDYRILK